MLTIQPPYFPARSSVPMARDANEVLMVELHTKAGTISFSAPEHTQRDGEVCNG